MIYIAINGDDVGKRIGGAIAADNHEELESASSAIKGGHEMVTNWVAERGGKTVTTAGDEGLYQLPEEALDELDSLRQSYQEMTGHTLTVGLGQSLSEASKALIYGKLNEKNQIVEYDPSIEDYLSEEDPEQGEIPSEGELEDEASADEEQEAGLPAEEGELPPEEEGYDQEPGEEELAEEEFAADTEESLADSDEIQAASDKHDEEPEHEKDMGAEQELEHDAIENEDDEADSDIIEADAEMQNEGLDGKIDGEDFGTDFGEEPEDGAIDEEAAFEEEDPYAEEGMEEMSPEDVASGDLGEETQSVYADEEETPEGEEAPEGEEGYDYNNMLTDMIHGQMEGEEAPEGEEGMEPEADGAMDEDLRSDIAEALMAFKDNKQMLEEARETAPQLYEATITMLRAMIQMAKQMGMAPEDDVEGMEAERDLGEQFPMAEEGEEAPPEEMMEEEPAELEEASDPEEEEENRPGKK